MSRILLALVLCSSPLLSQASLPFGDGKWELRGDSTALVRIDGREAVQMQSGFAIRRDIQLEDGTIDVDVLVTRRRSFVYVQFRMQDDREHEEFYLRPHKSTLPDAVQYAPVYQGQSAWQLYHGAAGTAAPEIEPGVWKRLRIVLKGRQAAVFLGDTTRPILLVPRMARAPEAGFIALRGFVPAGTPGSGPIVSFANVRVQPGVIPYAFPAVTEAAPPVGVIHTWTVGDAFAAPDSALVSILPAWIARRQRLVAERTGLLELHRHVPMPRVQRDVGVVARVRVLAEAAGVRRLDLGFSDAATVLLNGVPLVRLDASYNYEERRDGLIGYQQAAVYLPLKAGSNELAIIVTDRFGGWGLMGRIADRRGLRIEAIE